MTKERIKTIVIIVFAVVIVLSILNYKLKLESSELKLESISRQLEIERLSNYFSSNTDFEVKEVPGWYSVAPIDCGVEELKFNQYVITPKSKIDYQYYRCYPFGSKKEAKSYLSKLKESDKRNFILISQSLVLIGDDKETQKTFQQARSYFDENDNSQ